jgi:hypothetical protein
MNIDDLAQMPIGQCPMVDSGRCARHVWDQYSERTLTMLPQSTLDEAKALLIRAAL